MCLFKSPLPTSKATEDAQWFSALGSKDSGMESSYPHPNSLWQEWEERTMLEDQLCLELPFWTVCPLGLGFWSCSAPDQFWDCGQDPPPPLSLHVLVWKMRTMRPDKAPPCGVRAPTGLTRPRVVQAELN